MSKSDKIQTPIYENPSFDLIKSVGYETLQIIGIITLGAIVYLFIVIVEWILRTVTDALIPDLSIPTYLFFVFYIPIYLIDVSALVITKLKLSLRMVNKI